MGINVITKQWLAQRPYIIALVISVILILWMMSGVSADSSTDSTSEVATETQLKSIIPQVKVERFQAQSVHKTVELYGRTEPDRIATVKAEVDGRIEHIFVERGAFVKKGTEIARIALNDRKSQLNQAKALLVQRQLEFEGAKELNKSGYQGDVYVARAEADLESVKATIVRLELDVTHTSIYAPFDGVLNTRNVEMGDYVKSGDDIGKVADLSTLIVRAYVTENQIGDLTVGQHANVLLLNQQQHMGKIRYISSVADDATNTFKIEVAIDNNDHKLLAGISSEISIELDEKMAIKVSPALLALDAHGNIGIKTVVKERVVFTGINIVKSDSDGIWLSGLGEQADIITLGQGFVRDGDIVDAIHPDTSSVSNSISTEQE